MQKITKRQGCRSSEYFVLLSRAKLYLSAGVRDWILPYRYCYATVSDLGDLVLTKTNDTDGYKVTLTKTDNTASISGATIGSVVGMDQSKRYDCELRDDGSIVVRCGHEIV